MRDMVFRGAQDRIARLMAEARAVDPGLRMLDPHADREGLRLGMDAGVDQHGEGIARAVADREDDVAGGEIVAVVEVQAAQPAWQQYASPGPTLTMGGRPVSTSTEICDKKVWGDDKKVLAWMSEEYVS